MMLPAPWPSMTAPPSRQQYQRPSRFTRTVCSKSSWGSFSAIGPASPAVPAPQTRMSMRPKRSTAARIRSATCPASVTSQATGSAAAPRSASRPASSSRRSARRAASTTFAPASARASQKVTPIPDEAPVTTAVRPLTSKMSPLMAASP